MNKNNLIFKEKKKTRNALEMGRRQVHFNLVIYCRYGEKSPRESLN